MYERDIAREGVMIHLKITHKVHTQRRRLVLLLLPPDIRAYDSAKAAITLQQTEYL